jgi:type II secretory pathway pseudopilin PulG
MALARKRSRQGFTLAELVVSLSVLMLMTTLGVPLLMRASAGLRLQLAAAEVAGVLGRARMAAITQSAHVAVKFRTRPDGRVTFTLYRDMDGDGVRNRDIDRGIDEPLGRPRTLEHLGRGVGFGFPDEPGLVDPSGRRLTRLGDPIRFNRSDLASFGPLGTSTPGSLYLTDGRGGLRVVRVLGRTAKIKILTWSSETRRWH